MLNLEKVLDGVSVLTKGVDLSTKFNNVAFDSREIRVGDMFVALKGVASDGHDYIEKAISNGALIIICEHLADISNEKVIQVQVKNTKTALGKIASNYYDHPSSSLKLIGVTGTNGKTTVVSLLHDLFVGLGYKVGKLTTIHNVIDGKIIPTTHTTPDVLTINKLLREMVDTGVEYAFMEVSSHAIHQGRIESLAFTGGLFTNMSHDHLDYHETFAAYIEAKKTFFDHLPKSAFSLINVDDKRGEVMVQNSAAKKYKYSLRSLVDFKGKIIENNLSGLHLEINNTPFLAKLIGEFNAYNLLAVYGCAILLEQDEFQVLIGLSNLEAPEGRFAYSYSREKDVIGIVDYAHTPDALEKVLKTIKALQKRSSKVITVVGCGGNRDKAKRPIMAKISYDYSAQTVLTSDNPRFEDPEAILDDMEAGLEGQNMSKVLRISDRAQAIKVACRLANKGDVILIAGKGHEKYQDVNGIKSPFDDNQILKASLGIEE